MFMKADNKLAPFVKVIKHDGTEAKYVKEVDEEEGVYVQYAVGDDNKPNFYHDGGFVGCVVLDASVKIVLRDDAPEWAVRELAYQRHEQARVQQRINAL